MRRLWAAALLATIAFPLIAPAVFAADPDSKLPACCRRDGKHHCGMAAAAMRAQAERDAEPQRPALHGARCANFPGAKAAPAQSIEFAAATSLEFYAAVVSHPAAQAQTEALYRISYARSSQERGPPSLLL